VPNPANLLGSIQMRDVLEKLMQTYNHVVIDSPPALYFADSVIMATQVDAVVLIARANVSSRAILSRAKKKIQEVKAHIVGIVMNDVPLHGYQYYNTVYYKQLSYSTDEAAAASGFLHLS
jgi:Mrp family chromosome partitioning ATPase